MDNTTFPLLAQQMLVQQNEQRRLEQEEVMATYSPEDLRDWEFKIVRALTPAFKNRETLNKLITEEAQAGWIMVEKFDDSRIRFKRKTSFRNNDSELSINPYRSYYGISLAWYLMIIIGVMVLVFAFLYTFVVLSTG